MNIYVEDNSKNMQDESFQKNYRNDVYVKIDNKNGIGKFINKNNNFSYKVIQYFFKQSV